MQGLEPIIEDIYASALSPETWQSTLRSIARVTGSRDCLLQGMRFSGEGAEPLFNVAVELDREAFARHAILVSEVGDPRAEFLLQAATPGRVFQDHDFVSEFELRRHPYYQELLTPLGLKYCAMTIATIEQSKSDSVGVGFGLQRTPRQGILAGEQLRHFEELSTHMARALRIARRLRLGPPTATAPGPEGACFGLDTDAAVITLNESAQACLRNGIARLDRDRRLVFADPRVQASVDRAVNCALQRSLEYPLAGRLAAHGQIWSWIAFPTPRGGRTGPGPVAVEVQICMEPGDDCADALTPAEERLVRRLELGWTLRQAADQLGVTYETARTQIKRVLQKLDLPTQAALIALRLRRQITRVGNVPRESGRVTRVES